MNVPGIAFVEIARHDVDVTIECGTWQEFIIETKSRNNAKIIGFCKFWICAVESVAKSTHVQTQFAIEFVTLDVARSKTNPKIAVEVQVRTELGIRIFTESLIVAQVGKVKTIVCAVETRVGNDQPISASFLQWGDTKRQGQRCGDVSKYQVRGPKKHFLVGNDLDFAGV